MTTAGGGGGGVVNSACPSAIVSCVLINALTFIHGDR